MQPGLTKLSKASTDKILKIMRSLEKEAATVILKGMAMSALSVIPIVVISGIAGLLLTGFPFVAGMMTAVMIQIKYIVPNVRRIGEKYDKQIKEVLEEERRNQTKES